MNITKLFSGIPSGLRNPLIDTYKNIEKNFRERRWEPAELNGGKLCEIVYTILEGLGNGQFSNRPKKPQNMVDACRSLERINSSQIPRAVKIQIPRMLIALYEIRNNRGVGHVGGDVDPNLMDATQVMAMSQWIMADLVRIFHGTTTDEAQQVVDGLVERQVPLVWVVGDQKRILDNTLSMKDKVLLLLHSNIHPVFFKNLFGWVEHSHASNFKRTVLNPLHLQKYIEYDKAKELIYLSPKGNLYVEQTLLQKPVEGKN